MSRSSPLLAHGQSLRGLQWLRLCCLVRAGAVAVAEVVLLALFARVVGVVGVVQGTI